MKKCPRERVRLRGLADPKEIDMGSVTTKRTFDVGEIRGLFDPYAQGHRTALVSGDGPERVEVEVRLRATGATHAECRTNAVAAGNAIIAAIEGAGYEHASAPQIDIGGMELTRMDSEACDYFVHADLSMELLGKRDSS